MLLRSRDRSLRFPRRPLVMGIVDVCDDALSDDDAPSVDAALRRARRLVELGADAIDVGGEDAPTGRQPVDEARRIRRLVAFTERFAEACADVTPIDGEAVFPPWLSINTGCPQVAREVLAIGGDVLNDTGKLSTAENATVAARFGTALLIRHPGNAPEVRPAGPRHDVMPILQEFFGIKIAEAIDAGLSRDAIVLDPGIAFVKMTPDDLRILHGLAALSHFERPVLVPVPREPLADDALERSDSGDRDAGMVACVVAGVLRGAAIFRVHHVQVASQAVRVIWRTVGG